MLRGITVVAGPARCGKTDRLLEGYGQVLANGPIGGALWLSPTHRAAALVRQRLLSHRAADCFSPNCLTFDQFARRILENSAQRIRPVGVPLARQILKRLIAAAVTEDQLPYFGPIATTGGFLDLVVQFIQDFKRLEIWPEELAAACGRRPSQKDRELCHLYHQYQRVLTEHDLYDAQGRFWSARALLRAGEQRPFERVRHVLVDGFTDFTRTEHEIIEILAGRVDSLTVSLPLDAEGARSELFTKSGKTLSELRRRHPALNVEEMPPRATAWSAMDRLERRLFADARPATGGDTESEMTSDDAGPEMTSGNAEPEMTGVEIVAAGGAIQEIESLARRIKRLLVRGDTDSGGQRVRPGEIMVVFRSLAESAVLVGDVFAQFGIPAAIGTTPALAQAPIMSALVAWLRLDLEDWPFRSLLTILAHNYFRPAWPEWRSGRATVAAECLVRHLQLPSGRAAVLAQAGRLAERAAASDEESPTWRNSVPRRAAVAGPLLRRMARALDELPRQATLNGWAAAITALAHSLGLLKEAEAADGADPLQSCDREAWQQLVAALAAGEKLSAWIGQRPAVLSRAEFFEHLQDVLGSEPLAREHDETGRVRVLSAERARNLSAPYVFVAGLSEKAFPQPAREDCIYSEAETGRLVAAGLPLVPQADRSRFEMLLFYEVLTRATRRLVLSYPALDQRAQPLSPSPYLREIEHVCGSGRIRKTVESELSGVPASDDVFSPRDFRIRATARALEGDSALLAQLHAHSTTLASAGTMLAGLQASCARGRGESYGAYEGILASEVADRALRARFGPERCWSPSQLEQYARCPFQFFVQRVLGVEPVEEPALEIDYLGRGRILHWLLAELHRRLNVRAGAFRSPADETVEEFRGEVRLLAAEFLKRMEGEYPLDNGLLELDVRRVAAWLGDYRRQHVQYDAAWREWPGPLRPAHFEVPFGPSRHSDEDELPGAAPHNGGGLASSEPFELVCGGETMRFSGRIDRIDVGWIDDQMVFNVVDYKSGRQSSRTSGQSVAEGYSLQLPLYALAAKDLLGDKQAVPFRAAYWHVGGDGYKEIMKFSIDAGGRLATDPGWTTFESRLRGRILALVEGIRRGQFPMHSVDEKCTSRCEYSTICRVNQSRSLDKTWQPPSEGPP